MVAGANGSAFIIWRDYRNEANGGDIYGQLVDLNGISKWKTDGRPLINATGIQNPAGLIYSSLNCGIFVWEDNRSASYDIYAQKINLTSGNTLWNPNGTIICNAASDQVEPDITSDGNGGAIITWIDERNGGSTLFVQKIKRMRDLPITGWRRRKPIKNLAQYLTAR